MAVAPRLYYRESRLTLGPHTSTRQAKRTEAGPDLDFTRADAGGGG